METTKHNPQKHFEDFINLQSSDIFTKADLLNTELRNNPQNLLDGLGLISMQAAGPQISLSDGTSQRAVIMLGSNSYLNLTTHPKVIAAATDACERYGYGTGAVSLYGGITDLHKQLEALIAEFHGTEDAIVFPSGYGTNIGVISAVCNENDAIINDSANHASIFDGSILSGAEMKIYPHGNTKALANVLSKLPAGKGKLIITDGVFSMHGDLAKLDEISELAQQYNARVMVDDAHGIGIVGPTGRGTAEYFGVEDKIDLHVGMLSKAPGGLGGYCAASREVIQYLRLYTRSYFFSTALPAPIVAGLIEVIKMLISDTAGRDKLCKNIQYLKTNLQLAGFDTGNAYSGIIPIIVGNEQLLGRFHRELLDGGVYTNIVTYPAVRRKEARLRLCVMASLSRQQMDTALKAIIKAGRKCRII